MKTLDGFQLYGFFRAGSRRVHAARHYIDTINVFPVPDGDTGTNLSSTLAGALASTVPGASAARTMANLADAAILSARGNSGVIFAQFVSGLSEKIDSAEIRIQEFAEAVGHAHRRARESVSEPKEGTILSIIEAWAAELSQRAREAQGFTELIGSSREILKRSLAQTTERLPELKEAGVVDAGAAGFVEFVEGGHEYLAKGTPIIDEEEDARASALKDSIEFQSHVEAAPSSPPRLRYCVEAVVGGESLSIEAVRSALSDCGDCLIVAGGPRRIKIHVHADDPAGVMERLSPFGDVTGQKADDMLLQYRDAHERQSKVAIVTDSSCDLSSELIDRFGIHVVPLYILAEGSEYLDKLTIGPEILRGLSEGKGSFPRTSQPSGPSFARLFSTLLSHYEEVLAIHLSSAMSGTLAASRKEAEKAGSRVRVVDSRHLSGSLGLIVLRAAEAARQGMDAASIAARLEEWSGKARILVSVTSLRSMVKGGRVSPLKGMLAQALNLKPIVSVDKNGKSILYGKTFSEAANIRKIVAMVVEDHGKRPLKWYAVGHAGAPEKAGSLAGELSSRLGFPPLYTAEISSVVALNSGPGAVSVSTMAE